MTKVLPIIFSMLLVPAAFAAPVFFDFTYTGGTGATAVGQLSIDSAVLATLLAAPSDSISPISDLESLSMVVSGASAGNGTFGLSDFSGIAWWSAGATFDFTQNLVGQPTNGNPWGTLDGSSGDFNFFSVDTAPTGVDYFTLTADDGSADSMQLTSLQTVPEPGAMGLTGLAGLAMLALGRFSVRRG